MSTATAEKPKNTTQADSKGASNGAAPAEDRTLTLYKVLLANEDSSWSWVTDVRALSDVKAVQDVVTSRQYESGVFVAVPARSFNPRTVAVENKPRVRIS